MSKQRVDASDTIDAAITFLAKMQAEGWCLAHLDHVIEYGQSGKKGAVLPVAATVTVKLRPIL